MTYLRNRGGNPAREQWERTLRWAERLAAIDDRDHEKVVDFALVVLQNCFAARDWLITSGRVSSNDVNDLFSSPTLKLCRDIANGSKHLELHSPGIDPDHAIQREYIPAPVGGGESSSRPVVIATWQVIDLRDLCSRCLNEVHAFLEQRGVISAPNDIIR